MADIDRLLARARELSAIGETVAGTTTTANVAPYVKAWVKTDTPDDAPPGSDPDDDEKKKKKKRVGEMSTHNG